ncbi:DUF7220 family protein [Pseudomonas sp.]|uniref:DUF7220 family protein n=1 Tax=Pseudomonas sp. TaxID=306 RepID=UPI003FD81988
MTQTRKQSLIEITTSTTIGMVGSWLLTLGCLMFFTSPIGIATSTTLACTFYSISRGYLIRRYFNAKWSK